jgi:hypothetical protein
MLLADTRIERQRDGIMHQDRVTESIGRIGGGMPRWRTALIRGLIAGALVAVLAAPAWALPQIYEYRIEHPTYGAIGTYTNTVETTGGNTEVVSTMHVLIKVLGMVVYREDAQRTELWQNDRFTSFRGITITNGDRVEIHGEALDGTFVITSPGGTSVAPANVHPSNPWSVKIFNTNVMMSTKSGELFNVRLVAEVEKAVTLDGVVERLHQYEVDGDQTQLVWLNDRGDTIAFRVLDRGTPIDFVLVR